MEARKFKSDASTGLVFNIQRFSLQDGPGIRTTVFMKGCPLRCRWCSNPESQNSYPEIMCKDTLCNKCGECVKVCPCNAISIGEGIEINRSKCNRCMKCVHACPTGALQEVGNVMTIDEVVEESEKDIPFYQNSDGGVTLSGGEPLFQWEFSCQILERLKADGIHTAIDTTGYAPWNALEKLLKYTDLVLYDIKHIDSERHKEMTGVSNESILDNLRRTATKAKVWIRIPIIPHYNDSSETIQETAKFISGLQNVEKVSLLPYHEWGKPKYRALGREYLFNEVPPSNSQLQQLKEIIESAGFAVEIGS